MKKDKLTTKGLETKEDYLTAIRALKKSVPDWTNHPDGLLIPLKLWRKLKRQKGGTSWLSK